MTLGLVEFLRARLDEDEQVARAANPSPWRLRPAGTEHRLAEHVIFGGSYPGDPEKLRQVADLEAAWERAANAEHIARHDPARVLADVAAKRAILQLHDAVLLHGGGGATLLVCRSCGGTDAWFPDGTQPPGRPAAWPCPTARALAAPYADQLDYDPAWQPAEVPDAVLPEHDARVRAEVAEEIARSIEALAPSPEFVEAAVIARAVGSPTASAYTADPAT